ncbi:MAG TPA: hypothetical protein VMR02_00455 [Terracidiphilus sp.]|jgi:hypothetical protein|nr:hypothetical protein [Terracidiphilus sp.]
MKFPEEDRSVEFRQDTKLYSKSWVRNFLCLAMLVAIPYMAGFSQTKQNGSGNQTHDYSGIPQANTVAHPTADFNRLAELRKVELIEKLSKSVRNRMMAMGNN